MLDQNLPFEYLYAQPVKEFRHYIDSLYVISKLYLEEFISKNPNLSSYFNETELATLTYNRATQLMDYLNATSHLNEINEADYLRFLKQVSVNENGLLEVYEYNLFLIAYIEYYAGKSNRVQNLSPSEITLTKLQTVSAKIDDEQVKDYLLFTFLKDHVKYYGYKNTELLFKTFDFQCKNEQMKQGLLTPYIEYVKLSQKQQAPEIKLIDTQGNSLLLSEFKGTYIYIDVWATWCMPCRKEAPYFDALKDKYKHKNIEFVSISIDKTTEEWLEFLALKNLKANHFIAPDIQHFLDAFQIKTIPHFLIIDDNGNLINNDANRPSNKNTEWLDELPDRIKV
jgi:thiol-disulfide isomerase/thioredoxin